MLLSDINLNKITTAELIGLSDVIKTSFSKSQIKLLKIEIESAFSNGKFRKAFNGLCLYCLYDIEEVLQFIKTKGLFRYSNYIGKKSIIKAVAEELYQFMKKIGIEDNLVYKYLESIIRFSFISAEYTRLRLVIFSEIRSFESRYKHKSILKTLIANVEFGFLSHRLPSNKGDMSKIETRSNEEISSATSYLIYLLSTIKKLTYLDAGMVEERFIVSGDINRMIIAACYIEDYKEMEVQIDHFGYYLTGISNVLRLEPPFAEFERTMRLGYIRTELQSMNIGMSFVTDEQNNEILSIEAIADGFLKSGDMVELEYIEIGDYPRYVLKISEYVYAIVFKKFFKSDALLMEEAFHLTWIFKEQLISLDSLKEIKITDSLTILDFLKIKRVFRLMLYLYQKKFEEIGKIRMDVLLHSILPTIRIENFYGLLGNYFDEKMIDDFLDVISWEPGMDIIFDLQYRPITILDDDLIFPLFLMDRMNLIRNLYASEYKKQNTKLVSNGVVDPLTNTLSDCLTDVSISNFKQVTYKLGEIDLICIIEDTLVIVECKHTLQPASIYEMRTTYDYIQKAQKQLRRAIEYNEAGALLKEISAKTGIVSAKIKNVVGLVVISNRILTGNIFEYPVRDINELMNFITKGTFVTNDGEFALWESDKFSLQEFVLYLENDNKAINHMRDTLTKYEQVYHSGEKTIIQDTYFAEMEIALTKLAEFTKDLRKIDNQTNS